MSSQVDHARLLYAELAANYDHETRFITGIRRQAITALKLQPGETVLDAGCGTGWCLPSLSGQVGARGKVLGFEPSPHMLAVAHERSRRLPLANVELVEACGDDVVLSRPPDAVLFSYTHDLLQSQRSLEHILQQARSGARVVAVGTKLFPKWFAPGNWYLRHTHRMTITNFSDFDAPWRKLSLLCAHYQVRTTVPGSRYLFTGTLA